MSTPAGESPATPAVQLVEEGDDVLSAEAAGLKLRSWHLCRR